MTAQRTSCGLLRFSPPGSNTKSLPCFSPEIIDLVLSFLHGDKNDILAHQALARCLLVSRTFCALSRRRLFAQVTIADSKPPSGRKRYLSETRRLDSLLALLQDDPFHDLDPLAKQIQSLKVFLLSYYSPVVRACKTYTPSTWNDHRKNLPALLDALGNLREFNLDFDGFMDWNDLGKPIYDALKKLFWESATLRSISLASIYNFEPQFLRCPNFRELNLDTILLEQPYGSDHDSAVPPWRTPLLWSPHSLDHLESVTTRSSEQIFSKALEAEAVGLLKEPFARVKHFALHLLYSRALSDEWHVVKCAAKSLECLTVDGILSLQSYDAPYGAIRLSGLTSLRTLVLSSDMHYQLSPITLDRLASLLGHEQYTPTTVQSLVITSQVATMSENAPADKSELIFPSTSKAVWSKIDDILVESPSFSSLKKVELILKWHFADLELAIDGGTDSERAVAVMESRNDELAMVCSKALLFLPRLASHGRIEFKVDYETK